MQIPGLSPGCGEGAMWAPTCQQVPHQAQELQERLWNIGVSEIESVFPGTGLGECCGEGETETQ